MSKRLSYEEVKNIIESKGCKLLSTEYINRHSKLDIQCACGEPFKKTLCNFQQGQTQCPKCGKEKRIEKRRKPFEEIRDYINGENGNGCTLLSTEYINEKTPLLIRCACGEVFEKSFTKFQQGQKQCKKCGYDKITGENHVAYVERFIIQCSQCGKDLEPMTKARIEVTPTHFCCPECQNIYWSKHYGGENNPNWNPNLTEEERIENRDYPEYKQWRKEVYERDNYTCQCCGDNKGGNLEAHHLNGYNWDKDNRTNIDNGITLCKECHKEFHKIYGKKNNTLEQFKEFILNKNKKVS